MGSGQARTAGRTARQVCGAGKGDKTAIIALPRYRFWEGVVAPHDGFTGLVTGYKYKIKDTQKDLKRFSGERPSSPYPNIPEGAGTQQGELSAVGEPSQVIDNAMVVHDFSTLHKGLLPLFAGGAGAAAMAPGEAQAAIPADQYRFPAAEPGWVNPEPPLETPLVSPVELALAPAGVAKASGKVAAVLAEPFVAWGMDTAADWPGGTAAPALRQVGDWFSGTVVPGGTAPEGHGPEGYRSLGVG